MPEYAKMAAVLLFLLLPRHKNTRTRTHLVLCVAELTTVKV